MSLIIGIDIGTSKTAVSLMDPIENKIVKTVERETPYLNFAEPWKKEQSPREITRVLYDLLNTCSHEIDELAAIGITGQMHGVLGLDSKGNPITNFVTWQDGRGNIPIQGGNTLLEEMKEKAGTKDTKGISSGFGIVTLYYWMKNGLKPHKIATITDYIGMVLTGDKSPYIDPTMAESLGCYDVGSRVWKTSLLEKLGIPIDILPELIESTKIIGKTGAGIFSDIFKHEVPVIVSIGDNQASFLGSVKHFTDTVLLNIGTGAQISIAEESYQKASSLPFVDGIDVQIRPFVDNNYLIAGNAISGGVVYKTIYNFFKSVGRDIFGISNFDGLYTKMEELAEREIKNQAVNSMNNKDEADHLKVYPLFAGKRSAPGEKGWIKDISLTNFTPSTLIAETLKGMLKILTEMFDLTAISTRNYLVGSGNGIRRNKLLQNLIERMFGKKLNICRYSEEAVIGAAINAGIGASIYRDFREASKIIDYESQQ